MDGKLQILGNLLVTISVWISRLLFERKKKTYGLEESNLPLLFEAKKLAKVAASLEP